MIALGIDTGRWLGWTVLDGVRYLAAGVLDVEELGEDGAVAALVTVAQRARVEVAGIERVTRVIPTLGFQRGAAQQATRLVCAAWLGGELRRALLGTGARVHAPAAEEVRRHFVAPTGPVKRGEKKPDADKVIEAACAQQIAGWPTFIPGTGEAYLKSGKNLASDKRKHAADAALAALYAATVLR